MLKIAMLNCLKLNEICAGASCLKAFNEKAAHFETYKDEEVELVAYMRCNGCDADPETDAGMREKLERLLLIGTDIIHVGVCTIRKNNKECPIITKTLNVLEGAGVRVVRGTHY